VATSGLWFNVRWNDHLLWQFCTLFSLSKTTAVAYGVNTPSTPTRFFSAHCITFFNITAISANWEAYKCLLVATSTTNANLTSCIFAGNTVLAYFGAWTIGWPFSLVIIDSILERPSRLCITNASGEFVRGLMPPFGVTLNDIECPLATMEFTLPAGTSGKRRRMIQSWKWCFFLALKSN
jgi:hypothetical protein